MDFPRPAPVRRRPHPPLHASPSARHAAGGPPPQLAGKAPRLAQQTLNRPDRPRRTPSHLDADRGRRLAAGVGRVEADAAVRTARRANPFGGRIGRKTAGRADAVPGDHQSLWRAVPGPRGRRLAGNASSESHYVNGGGCWWETGGHSFSTATSRDGSRWHSEHVGPQGLAGLQLPLSGGDIDEPPQPLSVRAEARGWLDDAAGCTLSRRRPAPSTAGFRGDLDPGHLTLVAGREQDWIGGYRLDGWGWLWRIGGFWPNPDVALPVSIAALEYLAAQPPLPIHSGGVKYLWHATLSQGRKVHVRRGKRNRLWGLLASATSFLYSLSVCGLARELWYAGWDQRTVIVVAAVLLLPYIWLIRTIIRGAKIPAATEIPPASQPGIARRFQGTACRRC